MTLACRTAKTLSYSALRRIQQVHPKGLLGSSQEMGPHPLMELAAQRFLWMALGCLCAVLVLALGPQV